jgi:hypothetical protein
LIRRTKAEVAEGGECTIADISRPGGRRHLIADHPSRGSRASYRRFSVARPARAWSRTARHRACQLAGESPIQEPDSYTSQSIRVCPRGPTRVRWARGLARPAGGARCNDAAPRRSRCPSSCPRSWGPYDTAPASIRCVERCRPGRCRVPFRRPITRSSRLRETTCRRPPPHRQRLVDWRTAASSPQAVRREADK